MEEKIKKIFKKLKINIDENQLEAIYDDSDKLLIIAGAGSGKTTTMILKVYYLVTVKEIEPHKILMIAFTNEAVNEMRERLEKLGIYSVNIMTFHKLGMTIINQCHDNIVIKDKKELMVYIIEEKYKEKEFRKMLNKVLHKYYNIKIDKMSFEEILILEEFKKYIIFLSDNINKDILTTDDNHKIFKEIFRIIKEKYYKVGNDYKYIDFDMMIWKATDILINTEINFKINYIFVDEYQDISRDRFKLLDEFVRKFSSKLIAVGDDWQSIYKFAGSEVQIFTKWKEIYPQSNIIYLKNTYRNSQQLIDIASRIIKRNKYQFNKTLNSSKKLENPIKFYKYLKKYNKYFFIKILNYIIVNSKSKEIMILGRYNHDENILKDNPFLKKNGDGKYNYKDLNIYFFTIHSAKGLGYDDVIIVNFKKGKYGFPSEIRERINVQMFQEELDMEEERRLLYVALTRTKNRVYILVPFTKKSIFYNELKSDILK